jgi:hypothetical protein
LRQDQIRAEAGESLRVDFINGRARSGIDGMSWLVNRRVPVSAHHDHGGPQWKRPIRAIKIVVTD